MQHEVGSIVDGKVTGITKFGAFVELEGGTVGMVHISEVSQTYVNDISDYLKDQQQVKVKILSIGEDGKVSLSIKKALPPAVKKDNKPNNFNNRAGGGSFKPNNNRFNRQSNQSSHSNNNSRGGRQPNYNRSQAPKSPPTFEDMLSKFMSSSEEKFTDIKKPASTRRSGYTKKKPRDYD